MRPTSLVHQGWGRTVSSKRSPDAHVGPGWWLLLIAAWVVIVLQIFLTQTANAAESSSGLISEVDAAFRRADSLVELFEYEAAAKVLEKFLVSGQSIETKIRVNTKLASIYEQNLNEQQAIDCLLDNLRTLPSYKLPDSLRTQLERLYDKALAQYREEETRQNRSPKLGKLPDSKTMTVGKSLELPVSASDPDGDAVTLSFGGVPGATLEDKGNGTGRFRFTPSSDVAGQQLTLRIYADDGRLRDSARVLISVAGPPSRGEAITWPWWKSLMVPGSSQYHSGQRWCGRAFFAATALGIMSSAVFESRFSTARDRYNDDHEFYLNQARDEMNKSSMTDARRQRNVVYAATILVYAANAVQAYVHEKATTRGLSEAGAGKARSNYRPRLRLESKGVYLCMDL